MTTCVVIGANSFGGQDLIDLLMRETDWCVVGFGRSEQREPWNRGVGPRRYYRFDMNREDYLVCRCLDEWKPDYIVNFAAQSEVAPSWEHPEDWFQTNTVALAKLVNHLRRQTYLKKYLHVGSPECFGSVSGPVREDAVADPSTPYAASKAAAEMILKCYWKQFGFPLVVVRAGNYVGPRQQLHKLIPRTCIAIKQGRKVQLHGGGRAVKSWVHVRDVSRGELAILESGRVGNSYHLGPDRGVKVVDAVELVAKLMGKELVDVADVAPERPGQDAAYLLNCDKARTELGWEPKTCFRNAVQEVVDWVNENWQDIQKAPLEYVHRT